MPDNKIKKTASIDCWICERSCTIQEGKKGACGMYLNQDGEICEVFPDRYLVSEPTSVETIPMMHFYPQGKFLQLTTTGCNFNCTGCVSTVIVKEMDPKSKALTKLTPDEVVAKAIDKNCIGLVFLMNDPLASFLSFLELARLAKKHDLLLGCSSNTYFSEKSLAMLAPYLDFINVGLKGMTDEAYIKCGAKSAGAVFRNIEYLYRKGVHVEISCIYKRENSKELMGIAQKMAQLSPTIPLQIMRFIPLEGASPALEPSIREAEELCRELKNYLSHVYLFNSPGTDYLNTYCPDCNEIYWQREFYGPMGCRFRTRGFPITEGNICPHCGKELNIKGNVAEEKCPEGDGGYTFTRALEVMEGILITMGESNQSKLVRLWEDVLSSEKGLFKLHHNTQTCKDYIKTIRYFGEKNASQAKSEELAAYLEEKTDFIRKKLSQVNSKALVYYCMGKPLFCIKGERMENELVETAGGISLNRSLNCTGRPGMHITAKELNSLNPEVIFISAFIFASVEDVVRDCYEAGIDVKALREKRIYTHPAHGWDYGTPRWILGLMYMANVLHPEIFDFDLKSETQYFYKTFYNMHYDSLSLNHSFSKPSNTWTWKKHG